MLTERIETIEFAQAGHLPDAAAAGEPRHEGKTIMPHQAAEYIAVMLADLRKLASGSGLVFLAYIIEVAMEEAKIHSRHK